MSAKIEKKNKKSGKSLKIAIVVVALLLIAALVYLVSTNVNEAADLPDDVIADAQNQSAETQPVYLNKKLKIEKIGGYSGIYMEDGTDEVVSDILMMMVTNVSDEAIEYAEIQLALEDKTAYFAASVLPAGKSVVLLEKNRMGYDPDVNYSKAAAECVNMAMFKQELSLQEDKLEIQLLDGVINVTNISDEDITQTIILCYKNVSEDIYYGGIAYRIKLEGGLKAGEIRQIMASHFDQPGSEIVFVGFAA